jgi:hypothetical protein
VETAFARAGDVCAGAGLSELTVDKGAGEVVASRPLGLGPLDPRNHLIGLNHVLEAGWVEFWAWDDDGWNQRRSRAVKMIMPSNRAISRPASFSFQVDYGGLASSTNPTHTGNS